MFNLTTLEETIIREMIRVWAKKYPVTHDGELCVDAIQDMQVILNAVSLMTEYSVNRPKY